MKRTPIGLPLVFIVMISLACGGASATKQPEPMVNTPQSTVDTQATVNAAIAATSTMQSGYQAAVSTSVAATVTAMPPVPTPMPPEAYTSLTEDELATMTVTSVEEAATATGQASASAAQAAADGVITADELVMLYSYWIYADELIAYSEDLIAAYSEVYGELAAETLALLESFESDLNSAAEQADAILQAVEEIGVALEQGSAQTSQAVSQLETALKTAQVDMMEAQGQAQAWSEALKIEVQQRVDQALVVQPQQIADSRKAAIQSAFDYIASVQSALADMVVSQAELANIAQWGANAAASLAAQGGQGLAKLAASVNDITALIAGGQLSAAMTGVNDFQAALPAIP